jgi:hypothetical protein
MAARSRERTTPSDTYEACQKPALWLTRRMAVGPSVDSRAAGAREAGGQGHHVLLAAVAGQPDSRGAGRRAARPGGPPGRRRGLRRKELRQLAPGFTTRLRKDAALHDLPPGKTGRRGRPATGDRLPTLAKLAARQVFTQVTVTRYGKTVTVHAASLRDRTIETVTMTLADQAAMTGHDGQVTSGKPTRPTRRTFTAAYKARILAAYDALPRDGRRGTPDDQQGNPPLQGRRALRRIRYPGFAGSLIMTPGLWRPGLPNSALMRLLHGLANL